jgi:hypothetical protein
MVGAILLLLAVGSATFFFGDKYALDHLAIAVVSPDELGQAMKVDSFYSTYRNDTLVVMGKVSMIERKGGSFELVFDGYSNYQVHCLINSQSVQPILGSPVTLVAVASQAKRLPAGVLLQDCILP